MWEGLGMKMCKSCSRLNLDDAEVCIECDRDKFIELLIPFYNDIEPYLEEGNDELTRAS